jgi:hypothetical protein
VLNFVRPKAFQVARRWKFLKSKAAFRDMDMLEELPRAKAADLAAMLSTKGFQVRSRSLLAP